jgi:uncharacterized protein (UPF0210 family)
MKTAKKYKQKNNKGYDSTLQIRLYKTDKERYLYAAKSKNQTLSELIKNLFEGINYDNLPSVYVQPKKVSLADPQLIREINAIGNSLNQIRKKVNLSEHPDELNITPILSKIEEDMTLLLALEKQKTKELK